MPNCKEIGSEVPEVLVNLTKPQRKVPIHMRTNAVMAKTIWSALNFFDVLSGSGLAMIYIFFSEIILVSQIKQEVNAAKWLL
mmetsp:Transcript_7822/g.16980  ORF Transcript_7822/g.16980 Transcript_7822/m.16980 type:complete len:82 (-) Transcript_7822:81-326(-)